ncbi:hypothetical protein KEM54_003515 [Ascosphaera aggregata]|nr:hypothetical protein KEM54_003515 [Ascosphaera aggregata]
MVMPDQFCVTQHPSLGSTKAIEHSTVLPTLKEAKSSEETTYDAINWGPMAAQPAGSICVDFEMIQKELPYVAEGRCMDKYECFNSVLVKPSMVSEEKLPIYIVIHGGALFIGANSWLQYDTSRLVQWGNNVIKPYDCRQPGLSNIGKRKSNHNPANSGLLQFITGVRFYWPVIKTLKSAPANANLDVLHFHQPRPFTDISKGLASHEFDLALLLLNYSSDYDATIVTISELLAAHTTEFYTELCPMKDLRLLFSSIAASKKRGP